MRFRKLFLLSLFLSFLFLINVSSALAVTSANLCVGGTPLSSSISFPSDNAFNGNAFDYWASPDGSNGSWFGYDFKVPVIINDVLISQGYYTNLTLTIPNFTVYGNDDPNSAWVELATYSNNTAGVRDYVLNNRNYYRYIYIKSSSSLPYSWIVNDVEMFGITNYESQSLLKLDSLNSTLTSIYNSAGHLDFDFGIIFGGIVALISWMLLRGFGTRYV